MSRFTDTADLWSRPPTDGRPELVHEHLGAVANRAAALTSPHRTTRTGRSFREVSAVTGWGHDIGKLTEWFQASFDARDTRVRKEKRYTYHALLGATAVHYALERREFDEITCGLGFHATVAHHRAMSDLQAETDRYAGRDPAVENRYERVQEQFTNIYDRLPAYTEQLFGTLTAGAGTPADFATYLSDRPFEYDLTDLRNRPPDTAYGDLLYLTGILKLADRSTVVEQRLTGHSEVVHTQSLSPPLRRRSPDPSIVSTKIRELGEGADVDTLDGLRTDVQETVHAAAQEAHHSAEGGFVGTVEVPTGFGKTYAGLWTGLELVDAYADHDPIDDRSVVYALPYTSIIDQTAATIEELYQTTDPPADFVIDHYLAETEVDIDHEGTDDDHLAAAKFFFGNAWRANTVLSTFVQLFESLAGPTSKRATKLPSLQESVVVLDEPQLLPPRWWPLVGRLVDLLVDQFDATVLAMTATQPRIVEQFAETDPIPLVEHKDGPLQFLEDNPRVQFRLDESVSVGGNDTRAPKSYTDAAEEVVSAGDAADSLLAVCNTIDSARTLDRAVHDALRNRGRTPVSLGACLHDWLDRTDEYPEIARDEPSGFETLVAERLEQDETALCAHLSGCVRPADRLALIDFLKDSSVVNRHQTILTSTQLIEAGVDLSFDHVYRDFAPVPSIVQSAGRCNRNLTSDTTGTVTVWQLDIPPEAASDRIPSDLIYRDPIDQLTMTQRAIRPDLSADREITEVDMISSTVRRFYREVQQYSPGDRDLARAVDRGASRPLRRASMIRDREDQVDVIVACTSREAALIDRIVSGVENDRWDEVEDAFSRTEDIRYSVSERRLGDVRATEQATRKEIYDSPVCLIDATEDGSIIDSHYGVCDGDREGQ